MAVVEKEIASDATSVQFVDQRYRLTTEQYYKMGEAGVFGDDDKRVELIDGEIIKLAPIAPSHGFHGQSLYDLLRSANPDWYVGHENPIRIIDGTEPLPDPYVAKGPRETYRHRHPNASDLLLVVEVSNSSLASDRKRKLGLYASSGIPEFWIVNLVDKQVEVYSVPAGETYSVTKIFKAGDNLPLSFATGKSLPVAEFVP